MTPEGLVKKKVKKLLDEVGAWHCSPVAGSLGRAGIPDVLACVRGVFVAIECKAGRGFATKLQQYEMSQIVKAGGTALIINERELPNLREWLEQLTKA